jgi:Tol biopolymer transport system component
VSKDGEPFDAVDFNFWGVTFDPGDSNLFYATLATGGHHYLVEGNVRSRSMRVLRDGVECPSLSPDGTRIAYKSRIGDSNRWHLRVLDVATLSDHAVAERRSIDDQAEWLDERTLVYSDGVDVFTVAADGSGAPHRVLRDATSPVALRGPVDLGQEG